MHGVEIAEAGSLTVSLNLMQALALAMSCTIKIDFVAKDTDGSIVKCLFKLGAEGCGLEKEPRTGGMDEKLQNVRAVEVGPEVISGRVSLSDVQPAVLGSELPPTPGGPRTRVHLRSVEEGGGFTDDGGADLKEPA